MLKNFRLKSELLCNGLIIKNELIKKLKEKNIDFNLGRKGGAGPAGGRYFRLKNNTIVNTPLYIDEHLGTNIQITKISSKYQVELKFIEKNIEVNGEENGEDKNFPIIEPITLIKNPDFYLKKNSDGIILKKIAILHGDETLATTLNQRCKYWRGNQECRFCGIEFSLNSGATIEIKSGAQIVEIIKKAQEENPLYASHLTLTTGTVDSPGKGMEKYLKVVKRIRKDYPTIPIHIQIEPMKDINWYKRIHEVGADTVGIHLEILDEDIRKDICPGKSKIPLETYKQHWKKAIEVFGKNQVDTFILMGFEKNIQQLKQDLEEIIKIGVIPVITPAKYISGVQYKIPKTSLKDFIDVNLFCAKKFKEYGIDPTKNKAGCVKCGGCSPIIDAFEIVAD